MKTFVRMFKPRFAPLVKSGEKKQTVRPIPKRMPESGDQIDCREWAGKPYRSKQAPLGVFGIGGVEKVFISDQTMQVGDTVYAQKAQDWFARCDGFTDAQNMR